MKSTLPTTAGFRLAYHPQAPAIPADAAGQRAMAQHLDRQADLHLAEGRCGQADRLAHLAYELRCRLQGMRP